VVVVVGVMVAAVVVVAEVVWLRWWWWRRRRWLLMLTAVVAHRVFNGFINSGTPPGFPNGTQWMHYWVVESERDPVNDPVLVWYNGGPGATSLFGMLVELGPLLLNVNSFSGSSNFNGTPAFQRNPFAFSKVATVIALDNPPPVGFSYCDPIGPTGNGSSCGPWNDSSVTAANHAFLTEWINVFPEYADQPMYLMGESYAGIWVPAIARALLADPRGVNLQGFAVGDGCIGNQVPVGNDYYWIEFMHGHGQFSNALYYQIKATCSDGELKNNSLSPACAALVNQVAGEIGGYYAYGLYDDCVYAEPVLAPMRPSQRTWFGPPPFSLTPNGTRIGGGGRAQHVDASLGRAMNDYACPGDAMALWLNLTSAREAIGVPVDSYFFSGDDGIGFNYSYTEPNMLPFYADAVKSSPLRVMVYNGDSDPCVNSLVTQDIYANYLPTAGVPITGERGAACGFRFCLMTSDRHLA
jgi:hypothetical protein